MTELNAWNADKGKAHHVERAASLRRVQVHQVKIVGVMEAGVRIIGHDRLAIKRMVPVH